MKLFECQESAAIPFGWTGAEVKEESDLAANPAQLPVEQFLARRASIVQQVAERSDLLEVRRVHRRVYHSVW